MKNWPGLLKKSTIFVAFALLAGAVMLLFGANASSAQDRSAPQAEAAAEIAAPGFADLAESETGLYVVQLADRPLATYDGGIAGLAATSPGLTGSNRLDVNAPESIAYLNYLQTQHDNFISSAEIALGRSLDVQFQYLNVLNGLAVYASLAEAQRLADLPGVRAVYADELRELTTDVGPGVIGAPVFWDGDFGFDEHRGEGVIIGFLDTGVNHEHPSFAAVDGDGYVHDNPYGSGNYVGVCEDPSDPDYEDICNDKLIGAWNLHPDSPSATDWNNHGSHVGSTIAGNTHEAVFTVGSDVFTRTVSGVAPRANAISYLVCFPTCPQTSSVAAVNQAIADGVDVLNYSISGGDNPWNSIVDLAFLDATAAGMFVSASAGNAGPGPNTVAKTGPWNASVAASTHNRVIANTVDAVVDPILIVEDFGYGDSTAYLDLPPGTYTIDIIPTGAMEPAISATVTVDEDGFYTVIATGDGVNQDLELLVLVDDVTPPAPGTFHLRLGHLAPFAAGDALADVRDRDGNPILENVAYGDVTGFLPLPAGEYDLTITAPGGDPVLIDPLPVDLEEGMILSAFATGEGDNQALGVFALPSDEVGFFLPLYEVEEMFYLYLPFITRPAATSANSGVPFVNVAGVGNDAKVQVAHLAPFAEDASVTIVVTPAGPEDLTGMAAVPGEGPEIVADVVAPIIWAGDVDPANVIGCDPFPADAFDGAIALIQRGGCTFATKVDGAAAAGAVATIVYNHVGGPPIVMGGLETTIIPAVFIDNNNGDDLAAYASANPGAEARINAATAVVVNDNWQDVVAGFSSRGPSQFDLLKPDYTAPGVNILAAGWAGPDAYVFLQGTSMSSPHGAGAAALLVQRFPDWSVAEVKSALALTAYQDLLKEDGVTPADFFDIGSGRIDLAMATQTGLVMHETIANYEAANPDIGGDPKTLNQPSMVNQDCVEECSWTRTVRSVADVPVTYNASFSAPAGITVTVSPASFTITPGATQELEITLEADLDVVTPGAWSFAQVYLDVAGSTAFDSHILLQEDFSDETFPPAGWEIHNFSASGPTWIRDTAQSNSEPASARRLYGLTADGNQDDWLVTPPIELDSSVLTYFDRGQWMGDYGYSGVWISTDSCDPADGDFVELLETDDIPNNAWRASPVVIDLSAYDGETACLAFNYGGTFAHTWWIDDVTVWSLGDADFAQVKLPIAVIPFPEVPILTLDPEEMSSSQGPNTVETEILTVGNIGGIDLEWEVTDQPPTASQQALGATTPVALAPSGQVTIGDLSLFTDRNALRGEEATFDLPQNLLSQTITHSASQTILAGNAVACSPDGGMTTSQNQYLRTFTLTDFGIFGNFDVSEVAFGIENLTGTVNRDVTVNLYTLDGAFTYANLTLIGTATQSVAPQSLAIVNVPVTGSVPAGGTLVVEVNPGDLSGQAGFFIGSNTAGETAPSYIASVPCGITNPTPFGAIGFTVHVVMNVTGEAGGVSCDTPGDAWFDVDPQSGTVAPDGTQAVSVEFDSTGLSAGDYDANLCLTSNDPDRPFVVVPLTLEVIEVAQIEVDPTELNPIQDPDTVTTHTLTINSTGNLDLVWSIETDGAVAGGANVIYESGPFITGIGDGPDGADSSLVQNSSLGMTLLGSAVNLSGAGPHFRMADQFEVPSQWDIDQVVFYAYQTGSSTTSSFTGVNFRIWDGVPGEPGSNVVFGDTATNRFDSTGWTNVYRYSETTVNTLRPIMYVIGNAGVTLPAGTYWLDWQLAGTIASGPWQPPITIIGQTTTGNGLHLTTAGWINWVDGGTGTPQGAPFQLWGTAACDDPSDVSWLSVDPDSGTTAPGDADDVEVTVDTTGVAPGEYTAYLCINSNADNAPLVVVPVNLTVEGDPTAFVQVAHLAPFAADLMSGTGVTVTLNGVPALTDFFYGDSTAYIELEVGDYDIEVFPTGSASPAMTATVSLMADTYYTVLATGDGVNQDLALVALVDDLTPPDAGNFKLRLGHLAPFAAGSATADIRLKDGTPVLTDVNYLDITGFLELPEGTYDLIVTTPGGGTILIDPEPVDAPEGAILSGFATGEGMNQDLAVFALPADAAGFFIPDYGPGLPQHFEGYFPPNGWTVVDNGGDCVWQRNDQWGLPLRPNYAGGDGFSAAADSDRCGSGTTMDTELWTSLIDLSDPDIGAATIDFIASYRHIAGSFQVHASGDGGATWDTLLTWTASVDPTGPGQPVSLNLTPYVGSDEVIVSFHYIATGWHWWAQIDQVEINTVSASNAFVQVAHLAPFAADLMSGTGVTVTLNGAPALTDFFYGDSTAYIPLDPGTYDVAVWPAGSATPAMTATLTLDPATYYTVIATGDGDNQPLQLLALVDDLSAPAEGNFKLRVGHLAPFAAGSATADVRLIDNTPVLTDVNYLDVTGYLELPAGDYNFIITAPGGDPILINPAELSLPAGAILSAFATGDGDNQTLALFALPADGAGSFVPEMQYLLLAEDFSDTTFPPAGWSIHKLEGGGTTTWTRTTGQSFSPPASAFRLFSPAAAGFQDDWLVTPPLPLDGSTLSYRDRGSFMAFYGYSGVWISTASCDPDDGDFVELLETDDMSATWRLVTIDLSAYDGETACLAFRYSGLDAHDWWVDDVMVDYTP